jgi:hypothetical protein
LSGRSEGEADGDSSAEEASALLASALAVLEALHQRLYPDDFRERRGSRSVSAVGHALSRWVLTPSAPMDDVSEGEDEGGEESDEEEGEAEGDGQEQRGEYEAEGISYTPYRPRTLLVGDD